MAARGAPQRNDIAAPAGRRHSRRCGTRHRQREYFFPAGPSSSINGQGFLSLYAHLETIDTTVAQPVSAGSVHRQGWAPRAAAPERILHFLGVSHAVAVDPRAVLQDE